MESWDDAFGYKKLPGWDRADARLKTIDVNAVAKAARTKWASVAAGVGMCFGVLFIAQLLLAIASHDLKGHRARAITTGTAASVILSITAGVIVWRRLDENS
ncbi:MAG: hypothetical protein ACFB2W_00715 [Leptolyngbyaceae cyanobacterium]